MCNDKMAETDHTHARTRGSTFECETVTCLVVISYALWTLFADGVAKRITAIVRVHGLKNNSEAGIIGAGNI